MTDSTTLRRERRRPLVSRCQRLLGAVLALFLGIAVAPAQESASILPTEDEGKKVREIRITGLERIRESSVKSALASKVGQPFQPKNIDRDAERLERLGVFNSHQITVVPAGEEVDLEIAVSEAFSYLPDISLEISDENGWSGGPGFKSNQIKGRPFNFSTAAHFGGATSFEVILETPPVPDKLPWLNVDFTLRDRQNEVDHFSEQSLDFKSSFGKYIGGRFRYGGVFHALSLKGDDPAVTLSSGRDASIGLGAIASFDTRDAWIGPSSGWWNEVEATYNFLDGDFWTVRFDVRRYLPIRENHSIALFTLTELQTGQVGVNIPLYRDFHIGGTNSIRGWELDARRGASEMINTLEYRWNFLPVKDRRLYKKFRLKTGLQLAVFGDFGTAWDNSEQFSKNFIGGFGVGIRLLMPWVQTVRLDFGFVGQQDRGTITHIGIRPKAVNQLRRIR